MGSPVMLTETSAAAATVIIPTIRRTAFFAATDLNDMETVRTLIMNTLRLINGYQRTSNKVRSICHFSTPALSVTRIS